jgi:hypothetical protein
VHVSYSDFEKVHERVSSLLIDFVPELLSLFSSWEMINEKPNFLLQTASH